ncbi:MAG: DUF3822 family protein [Microscillaceae bacterium]|jgi:hypothetical protein|nr:DUF3822 family protein [Microscillaceae bacterium]
MNIQDKVFKQETNIKDPSFDIEAMNYYRLFICLGEDSLRFNVVNSRDNKCLLLEEFRFFSRLSVEEQMEALNRIYDNDLFLKANFWFGIYLIIKASPFTLVPREFFDEVNPVKYLQHITPIHTNQQIFVNEQRSLDAVNVFLNDNLLIQWFKQTYPNRHLQYIHQTQAFIEGIRRNNLIVNRPQMHVLIEPNYLIISVLNGDDLEFCNTFQYRVAADFVYFVLLVMDELHLDKQACELTLYGKINPISEIYKLMRTYVGQVKIYDEQPDWVKFSSDFDGLPHTYYFDLYGMALCAT